MEFLQESWTALRGFDWWSALLWTGAVLSVVIGFVGTIVPALPGIPMIFIGIALAAWAGNFAVIGWFTLAFCLVLTVIGFAVDWIAQSMGAKKAGASRYGIAGALVGTVVGIFFGFIGIFFFPLIGAFLGEFIAQRGVKTATAVGWATWLGMLAGTAVKVGIAFVMVGAAAVAWLTA